MVLLVVVVVAAAAAAIVVVQLLLFMMFLLFLLLLFLYCHILTPLHSVPAGVTVNCLNPGIVRTEMYDAMSFNFTSIFIHTLVHVASKVSSQIQHKPCCYSFGLGYGLFTLPSISAY